MHPDIYFQVIAPTLVSASTSHYFGGSAFVGITTLGDDTNFVGKIITAISKRTGKPIFNTIEITLVCDDCKDSGKSYECIHRLGEIPYWQDDERHKDLQEIMKEREEDFLRETKGINSNSCVTPAFSHEKIKSILKAQRVDIKYSNLVFTSADPNAGGNRSRFAIASFVYDKDDNMVVSSLFS